MFKIFMLTCLAGLLVACVPNPEQPRSGTAPVLQNVLFQQRMASVRVLVGDELVRTLTAAPMRYVRSNGQAVEMVFNPGGGLRVENGAAGRTSFGRWTADAVSGQVCQSFPDASYCFSLEQRDGGRLRIYWYGTRSITTSDVLGT